MVTASIPKWAFEVLACPQCRAGLELSEKALHCARCGAVGHVDRGVACFEVDSREEAVAFYEAVQGPRLHERMTVPYTTSSLDAPVYRAMMEELRPGSLDGVVVDAGAGDGRNTDCWLDWGYRRVVATDAVLPPLLRMRERVAKARPTDLERLLLVKADVRKLPLAESCAAVVMAIEVLCLLGSEYESAVEGCAARVAPGGHLLVSDFAMEGALLSRVLYAGVEGVIDAASRGVLTQTSGDVTAEIRLLRPGELAAVVAETGLEVIGERGLSAFAPLLGFLRGLDRIGEDDQERFPAVVELLERLSREGRMHRADAVLARRPS